MDYLCLGPLEVRVNGVSVDLGEPQQRLVLALLLSQAGAVVSMDRLVDDVWGDDPPSSARKIVQGYVSGLRKALEPGDVVESRAPGYRLRTERGDVDARRFGDLVAEASDKIASDPDRARGVLREALAMWHGSPYEDLSDHDALRPEVVRLESLHMTAVQLRIEADIYADDALLAVAELADLTQRHPLEERLWALRMLALYRSGRQAEALRAFDEARRILAHEVGLEPSTELRGLQQRILDQDPVLDTSRALSATPSTVGATGRNPYKGLRAFEESDAADFCGRDDLVRRLREAIGQRNVPRLVVLAGPSGSGKSSVVRAGLFPMLRSEKWQLASMYPGTDPIEVLESALRDIQQGGFGLILVDQLEELLSAAADDADRDLFLDRLSALAEARDGPWIVATVRTDLLDRFLTHLSFARLVADGLLLVTPLEEHQVRDIVARPASQVGTVVEADLTAAIVADVVNRPAALPLLEFALTDLYDRSGGVTLSLEAYRAAGGISGSLVKRAEEMYAGLGADAEETTRQLFLRLVALTEDGEPIRRRRQSSAVSGIDGVDEVLELFGRHRLLTFDQDPTGHPTVEVAHEALLTQWPRLRNWIDDAQDSIRLHRQLSEAEAEWEAHGRSAAYLLTGPRLARLLDRTHEGIALTAEERAFLDVSTAAHRRSRRRRTGIVWSLVVVFAVLAGVAAWQRNAAQHEARQANVRRVAVESTLALAEDPEVGILLALEAVDISRRAGEPPLPEAVSALQGAVQASRLEAHFDGGALTVAVSPDGSLLVTDTPAPDGWVPTNEVVVWDAVNRVPLRSLLADVEVLSYDNRVESGGAEGRAFAFSPDGRRLAVAYQTAFEFGPDVARNAPIIVWDPTTGEQLARLVTSGWVTWDPTWSSDGAFLSAASWDGGATDMVTTWEVASSREVSSFRPGLVGSLAAYHGDTIAVAQRQAERVGFFDLHSGEEVDSLETPGLGPRHVAMDLGGDRLVLDGGEELQAWDMASRTLQWSRPISSPRAIAVSPDGTTVAVGGDGGLIRLLDLDDGAEVMEFAGSVGVGSVAYDPTSDLLASVDITGTRLWDVSAGGSPALGAIELGTGWPWVVDFSPDGAEVSLSRSDGRFERRTANSGKLLGGFGSLMTNRGVYPVVSQEWGSVAYVTEEGVAEVRNLISGELIRELPPCTNPRALSPDGSLVLVDGWWLCNADPRPGVDLRSRVIDVASGAELADLGTQNVFRAAFNPGGALEAGRYVAVSWNDGELDGLYVVDIATGETVLNLDISPTLMAFDPTGRYLASGTFDGRALVIDLAAVIKGALIADATVMDAIVSPSFVTGVALTANGTLATAGLESTSVRLWDIHTGNLIVEIPANSVGGSPPKLVFSPDDRYLLYTDAGNVLRKFLLDIDELIDLAEGRVTRVLTNDECRRYLYLDPCP